MNDVGDRDTIKEYEDRWVLQPMRGSRVVRTIWHTGEVEFVTDRSFRIVVGLGAEMAYGSIAEDAPGRHALTYWPQAEVERMVSAPILSPVLFKSGGLRIALGNGWRLIVPERGPEVSAMVFFEDTLMWDRSEVFSPAVFPIAAIDPWTGQRIVAPPWPPRPDDLSVGTNSDDING
ncbi:hypothetical protein AB0H76_09040 [Nocardia sp. NPDC050712]|uniref:hypothetical protein n=1 Tax=Nocardia sp. NPDC050712 TaxID=3155518 RepID=UPI0033E74731